MKKEIVHEQPHVKKALTAFIFFSVQVRPEVVAKNPDMKFGDVGKQVGILWKALTEEQKKPYHEMARVDKKRYLDDKEMEERLIKHSEVKVS